MIGFVMGKLNLLIFVMAMAVIILFFSNTLTNVLVGQRAEQIVSRISSNSDAFVAAETTCDSVILQLPSHIDVFSGDNLNSSQGSPYLLRITNLPNPKNDGLNWLVFTLALTRQPDKAIAAIQLKTRADIHLLDLNRQLTVPAWQESSSIVLNPLSAEINQVCDPKNPSPGCGQPEPDNRIVLIKEGLVNPQLYLYPCSVTRNFETCESYASSEIQPYSLSVLSAAKPKTIENPNGGTFQCFPLRTS